MKLKMRELQKDKYHFGVELKKWWCTFLRQHYYFLISSHCIFERVMGVVGICFQKLLNIYEETYAANWVIFICFEVFTSYIVYGVVCNQSRTSRILIVGFSIFLMAMAILVPP